MRPEEACGNLRDEWASAIFRGAPKSRPRLEKDARRAAARQRPYNSAFINGTVYTPAARKRSRAAASGQIADGIIIFLRGDSGSGIRQQEERGSSESRLGLPLKREREGPASASILRLPHPPSLPFVLPCFV